MVFKLGYLLEYVSRRTRFFPYLIDPSLQSIRQSLISDLGRVLELCHSHVVCWNCARRVVARKMRRSRLHNTLD